MHHLAPPPDEPAHGACHGTHVAAAGMPAPQVSADTVTDAGTDAGHGLHLCMAVLGGSVFLLLAWLLLAVSTGFRAGTGFRAPRWRDRRARRPAGRSLLTSVCVWRI
jgi:hypothetical protein